MWCCVVLCGPKTGFTVCEMKHGQVPINTKELVPIVLAVAMWGSLWRNSHVLILCDNLVVVMVLQARTCKDAVMMHLLRSMHFFLAKWDIALTSQHIPGATNHAADALSHNNMQAFHSMMKDASPPTAVPQMLWGLLVTECPDWTSVSWRSKLRSLST